MKKMLSKFLVLLLALSLTIGGFGVCAATVTYQVEGDVMETVSPTDGRVVLPATPLVKTGAFVGWQGVLNGESFLLPAGAVLEDVTEDLTVTAVTLYYATQGGATLRVDGEDMGVRYTSTISTADYESIVALVGEDNAKLGTYIVPNYYLQKVNSKFDLALFETFGFVNFLNIPAKAFYSVDEVAGTSTIAGSVCSVLPENRTLDFCGCGYLDLTYSNGESKVLYADFMYGSSIYSLTSLLYAAYEDRNTKYPNLITEAHGPYVTHSNYTMAELDLMKSLLDTIASVSYSPDTSATGSYQYFSKKSTYYTSPWSITANCDDYGKNVVIVTPSEGHSINELVAVAFTGRYRSMTFDAEFVNGTFRFVHNEWITVNPH